MSGLGKSILLGIDLGTSSCKVASFDYSGNLIAQTSKNYPTSYSGLWAEQNPEDWWQAIKEGIKKLIVKYRIDPGRIAGIGIDGQSWAALPIGANGLPLRMAMIWLDRRAEKQCMWMREKIGEKTIFEESMNRIDPAYIIPKILWIKENEPQVFARTKKFLSTNSYISYKLTSKLTQDISQSYGFHLFNMRKGSWSGKLSKKMGIPQELLPDIYPCSQVIGEVTSQAAKETGLVRGIPVVAGGLDAAAATLGAGVIEPGQVQEQGGQAGGMSICLDRPIGNPRLILGYHVVPERWLLQGGTTGGGSLRWLKNIIYVSEIGKGKEKKEFDPFEEMSLEAEKADVGSDGLVFLPYMAGERSPLWDPNAKGIFFGLSYEKTRAHLIRAIMEGCAFALHHNLQIAKLQGVRVDTLISVGGAARSKLWTQIKADVTGKPIMVPYYIDSAPLGAAILAGVGTGVYSDFKEAVESTVKIKECIEPRDKYHSLYQKLFEIYQNLYLKLREDFEHLVKIRQMAKSL